MRRWISSLLAVLMLANLAAWPSLALAEVLEHEREVVQVMVGQDQPVEPSPVHCQHGCAAHFSQHFQWQAASVCILPRPSASDSIVFAPETAFSPHVPILPFRPPLTATIRS